MQASKQNRRPRHNNVDMNLLRTDIGRVRCRLLLARKAFTLHTIVGIKKLAN
jgi:hypothetical protein